MWKSLILISNFKMIVDTRWQQRQIFPRSIIQSKQRKPNLHRLKGSPQIEGDVGRNFCLSYTRITRSWVPPGEVKLRTLHTTFQVLSDLETVEKWRCSNCQNIFFNKEKLNFTDFLLCFLWGSLISAEKFRTYFLPINLTIRLITL